MHNITKSYATEDSFINECKIINLEIEYRGATSFVGTEHYAIVTNLSEEALISKYDKELTSYKPFVIITHEMYEVIKKSNNNDERENKRNALYHDAYAIEDERIPVDEQTDPAAIAETNCNTENIYNAIMSLPGRQGQRLYKKYVLGYSTHEIAVSEGVTEVSVLQSISRAKKTVHDVFVELGVVA